jgi:hypothetical protein
MPAKAGIQEDFLDSRVRGNDGSGAFASENVRKYMIGCLLERKAGLELALPF